MDEALAAPRTEFVCFGRPVKDVIGIVVNSLTVTVAAITLGFATAALVDGTDVTLVWCFRNCWRVLNVLIIKIHPQEIRE